MAAQQLGELEQARQYFATGKERYRTMLNAGKGMLSPYWRDEALIELLLKEADEPVNLHLP